MHRTLGVFGIAVAAGVVISGSVATSGLIPRATGEHVLVTSNSLNLVVFATLVSLAIYKRRQPQVHKRLMLVASVAIIGPAVGPDRTFGIFLGRLYVLILITLDRFKTLHSESVAHSRTRIACRLG